MMPDTESAHEYFEDHYDEIAEDFFNDDASGLLSEIGEFVLNNEVCFAVFLEEWSKVQGNEGIVRDWYMSNLPDNDEDLSQDR